VTIWKLTLEYDGTGYSGWQEQKNARSIQGALREAAESFFGREVELQGSGRTDAGVHALGQVAHLRVADKPGRDAREIVRELNDRLPASIVVRAAEPLQGRFHARHDAERRTYLYQIATRKLAFMKKYVWWVKTGLDVEAMARAAALLAGRHDFVCFRAQDHARPDESTIVVVDAASVEVEGDLILFRITASHFLWRMVRRVAGVLVKIGMGEVTEAQFAQLLAGRADKRLDVAAWTAPAAGLFLERVEYSELRRRT
jgi:tRNA pseudouridine38-40 synthase